VRDENEPLQVYETDTILSYESIFQTTKDIKANEVTCLCTYLLKSWKVLQRWRYQG